jgi:hypothetical protein
MTEKVAYLLLTTTTSVVYVKQVVAIAAQKKSNSTETELAIQKEHSNTCANGNRAGRQTHMGTVAGRNETWSTYGCEVTKSFMTDLHFKT